MSQRVQDTGPVPLVYRLEASVTLQLLDYYIVAPSS